jgi:DNA repair protein RadC
VAPDHHAYPRILGHNHPSGAINPGDADQKITRKLVNAGLLFEITVFDQHIITNEGF